MIAFLVHIVGIVDHHCLKRCFMLYWQTFKKKNFHIGKDNDGDLEIPDNDYVCPVLPFISYQLVLEINVD